MREPEPVIADEPPLFQRVSSTSGGRGIGFGVGMLVIGLLAGFGGGFVAGQRMAPPPPPRVVEVPRPAQAIPPAPPPPVVPAQNFTEAPVTDAPPVEVREPQVQPPPTEAREPAARPTARNASGSVQFASRPTGATVYVDDVRVGVTPVTMNNVPPGTHQVRMELLGHQTWRTSVNVEAGVEARVGASLE